MTHKQVLFSALASAAALSLTAADSEPKEEVAKAAAKLADSNYSWRTTVKVPESSQFKPGPTEGKTEKDGFTQVKVTFNDNTTEIVVKGEKAAVKREGEWQSLSDLENAQGPGRFMVGMIRNFKAPAAQVKELLSDVKDLKKEGDAYSGDLSEEGAKKLLTFRRRQGGDGPNISNAKGSAKFWLKDGALTKYEFNVKGTISFNGNDIDSDRTSTVEIKEVGSTKVEVPDEAKNKLS